MPARSCSVDRKLKRIAGGSPGSADLIWTEPVLSERSTLTFMVMPCGAWRRGARAPTIS